MGYRFYLGASGAGKTYRAFNDIINESIENKDKNFFIIVPEQFTMQTQKDIVQMHPSHASNNIDVLSFNRLAYRIFEELDIENPKLIDELDKALILRRIANKVELKAWKKQFQKAGFIDNIKALISEFMMYDISDEFIKEQQENKDINSLLKIKLEDIYKLKKGFGDYIAGKYFTNEQVLDILNENIINSDLLKDSIILLDGFAGFTPVQNRIISNLMNVCDEIRFCITLGKRVNPDIELSESDLFFTSGKMISQINEMAKKADIKRLDDINLNTGANTGFRNSKDLNFFEEHFLRYDGEKSEDVSDIEINYCMNPLEEIDFVANKILKLVKDEGYRYRDIAIIYGDLEVVSDSLINRFSQLEIPYYLDEKMDVNNNELVEFINACIALISENFSYDAVNRYLRLGLLGFECRKVSLLDNYLLESGIRGYKRLHSDFTYLPKSFTESEFEEINEFKKLAMEKVSVLYTAMSKSKINIKDVCDAFRKIFTEQNIEEKLEIVRTELEEVKDLKRAREYEGVLDEVLSLFERLELILEGESITKKELTDLLHTGFEEIKLGMIPDRVDRVVIGDLKRTRLSAIKALFVCGANDGKLPTVKDGGGLINDREKRELKSIGFNLSDTVREDLYTGRFYLYRMLTKPSNKLFISLTGMDFDGKTNRPSILINMIKSIFPNIEIKNKEDLEIYSKFEAKEYLTENLRRLRAKENIDEKLLKYISTFFDRDFIKKITSAAMYIYKDSGIGESAARELFGEELRVSVTRLENYNACPFEHFISYGLGVEERAIHSFNAADIGSLVHDMLEKCFKYAKFSKKKIAGMSEGELYALVDEAVKESMAYDKNSILEESKKSKVQLEKIVRMTKLTMLVLAKQLEAGNFIPFDFERIFGEKDNLEALNIDLKNNAKMYLRGKIDRVDICEENDKTLVKIIDYKTGNMKWEMDMPYYGRALQLVIYLDAVMEQLAKEGREILPAAFFYYHIDAPFLTRDEAKKENAFLKKLKPSGIVNTDLDIIKHLDKSIETDSDVIPVSIKKDGSFSQYSTVASTQRINLLRKYVKQKAKNTAESILSGDIAIKPSLRRGAARCDYCPYSAICGFDEGIEGFSYNNLARIKDNDVWEKMESEEHVD
nr:PD-(D/E)XK nuclease family protein [uncultured Lachnoanaerobaculum sp.]